MMAVEMASVMAEAAMAEAVVVVEIVNKGCRRGCNGDGGALASAGQLDYHL